MATGCLLNTIPLSSLCGIGPNLISKFARCGLKSVQDLLLHLPARYEDRTKIYSIGEALPGMTVTVQGKVLNSDISFGRKCTFTCRIRDNSSILTMRFFNFNTTMIKNRLYPGQRVIAYGEIRRGQYGNEIIHPEYHILNERSQVMYAATLTPVYPTIDGVRQSTLRRSIKQALKLLDATPVAKELLPPECYDGLISLTHALHMLHYPPPEISLDDLSRGRHPAQYRLILEELLAHNLSILAVRAEVQKKRALPLRADQFLAQRFIATLPFVPTSAQKRVVTEITQDLARDIPMMRLVQGDVGSGKTLVAALAALCAISSGRQVALMAPTELLAEQHTENFRNWFAPLGIEVGLLVGGKQKGKIRQAQHGDISNGRVAMVVGTHAIFQTQVRFSGLALVIIDEQHRFGVQQRLALWEKGLTMCFHPHQLIMTATPIPRTLAMTIYADLDTSVLDELPPGRKPVTTVAISDTRRSEIIKRVQHVCLQEQRQAYWVCTLIEESHALAAVHAAKKIWQDLHNRLPDLKIGLVHGRMKAPAKQQLIQDFKNGEMQLLVATTIIEVGVDVPNASLIIIENAERLGLAQLHQLRGRVGRSIVDSYCVLIYKSPLSKIAQARLQALRDSNDGFLIAQRDLEIRGPGDLLGTRQTGHTKLRVANLLRDQAILKEIPRLAQYMNQYYPNSVRALIARWMPEYIRHYTIV